MILHPRAAVCAATAALCLVLAPSVANADSTPSTNPDVVLSSGSVHVNGRTFTWSKQDSCYESVSATPLVSVSGDYSKIGTLTQIASDQVDSVISGYGDSKGFGAGIELCPTGSSLGFSWGSVAIGPTAVFLDGNVDGSTPSYTDDSTATMLIKPDSSLGVARSHRSGRTTIAGTLRAYQLGSTGTAAWARNTYQSVSLYQKSATGSWVRISSKSTGSTGTVTFSFKSGSTHQYYLRYNGSSSVWSNSSGVFSI